MKGKIVIDKELCKGCKYCIISCPRGLITIEGKFNSKGYFPASVKTGKSRSKDTKNQCTGCAMCAEMCPEIAIEVWQEVSGTAKRG